jgi:glucan 1,3-beta-glucosidase
MLAVSSLPSLPFYRTLTQPISYGTAVEHHSLYQYPISNTHSIFAGFIQTETPYYQPIPDAKHSPYPSSTALNDPTFSNCPASGNCDAWGLRITNSQNVFVYGAGLYSFFNSYSTTCSNLGGLENCQSAIADVESSGDVFVYNLNTVGSQSMMVLNAASAASYADNVAGFADTVALFKTG